MEIKREFVPAETIEEFADREKLVMVIRERRVGFTDSNRFYAHFEDVEVGGDGVLIGTYGNGATEEEAIQNYTHEISLKHIVFRAFQSDRREIAVPRLRR